MEPDAVTASSPSRPWVRPMPGKGKGVGPTTTLTGRREVEGWWMRPCRRCNGRHMDKDCPMLHHQPELLVVPLEVPAKSLGDLLLRRRLRLRRAKAKARARAKASSSTACATSVAVGDIERRSAEYSWRWSTRTT
eukprot:11870277-Heterocapsa_arctica.AAC.1